LISLKKTLSIAQYKLPPVMRLDHPQHLVALSTEGAEPNRDNGPARSNSAAPKLLRNLSLRNVRSLLALGTRSVALFEAHAAARIASFLEGRREIVTAAIPTDEYRRFGRR
jgi:hypothetical protein